MIGIILGLSRLLLTSIRMLGCLGGLLFVALVGGVIYAVAQS